MEWDECFKSNLYWCYDFRAGTAFARGVARADGLLVCLATKIADIFAKLSVG